MLLVWREQPSDAEAFGKLIDQPAFESCQVEWRNPPAPHGGQRFEGQFLAGGLSLQRKVRKLLNYGRADFQFEAVCLHDFQKFHGEIFAASQIQEDVSV